MEHIIPASVIHAVGLEKESSALLAVRGLFLPVLTLPATSKNNDNHPDQITVTIAITRTTTSNFYCSY